MAKKTIETSTENGKLRITTEAGTITIHSDTLSDAIRHTAMLHGLKQKICDAAALGAGYTDIEKFDAMQEVANRLFSGEWNKTGRGDGTGNSGLLFRALCELYPNKTPEIIREFLDGKDKKEQAALRINPKIAAIIDRIRAERNTIDTDELLDELN